MNEPHSAAPLRFTVAGFRLGFLMQVPLLPGLIAFGIAYGTIAARKGFSLADTLLMSGTVFAGIAQVVALEAWPERLTLGAVIGLGLIAGTASMRFLLIGASLRPWLGPLPARQVYPTLYFLTDVNWLLAMRYHAGGGRDAAFLLGSGIAIWIAWVLSAIPGYLIGSAVDTHRYGLDLVVPAFFAAMLVPLWRGPRRALSWAIAGGVALAVDALGGGWWGVPAGALAGSLAAGFVDA